jgi:hypothetical protein
MGPTHKGMWFDDEGQATTEDKTKYAERCKKYMVPEA